MNTLLHFADSAIQYQRGKQTGLWGLIGIGLGILSVIFWDEILPFFEFIGLVNFFNNLGLVHTNAPYMTFFKIVMFFFLSTILFQIIGIVLIGLVVGIAGMTQSSAGQKLLILLIGILLSPIILVFIIYTLIFNKSAREDKRLKKEDPEAYKEKRRLNKNKVVIDYLKLGINEDKDYTLIYEDAYQHLNRLPTDRDHDFLLGVSYEREVYMLLPCALTVNNWKNNGDLIAVSLDLDLKYCHERKNKKWKMIVADFTIERIKDYFLNEFRHSVFKPMPLREFEELIDPSENHYMSNFFYKYSMSKEYTEEYVRVQQGHFFNWKNKLSKELQEAKTEEEYNAKQEELKFYRVPNEDTVREIWQINKNKETKEVDTEIDTYLLP